MEFFKEKYLRNIPVLIRFQARIQQQNEHKQKLKTKVKTFKHSTRTFYTCLQTETETETNYLTFSSTKLFHIPHTYHFLVINSATTMLGNYYFFLAYFLLFVLMRLFALYKVSWHLALCRKCVLHLEACQCWAAAAFWLSYEMQSNALKCMVNKGWGFFWTAPVCHLKTPLK